MMRRLFVSAWFALLALNAVAQEAAPMPPDPLLVRVAVVLGSDEGASPTQYFDETAEGLAPLVSHLPYGRYRTLLQTDVETSVGQHVSVPLQDGHGLYVFPSERTPEGLVRTEAQVMRTLPDGGAVRAIDVTALLPPNGVLRLEGVRVGDGELIVVVALAQPDDGQGQPQPSDSPDEDEAEQDQEQEQRQDPADAPEPEDNGEEAPRTQPEDQMSAEEMQNLEAILQSLEEMDEREIRDTVNSRNELGMRGREWW